MRFDLLTIFPEIFNSYLKESIIKRAVAAGKIEIFVHDIRKFSKDKHHKVDDIPYGGGPGMVMTPQPIYDCIQHEKKKNKVPFGLPGRTAQGTVASHRDGHLPEAIPFPVSSLRGPR